jgi:hypothetical protein
MYKDKSETPIAKCRRDYHGEKGKTLIKRRVGPGHMIIYNTWMRKEVNF